MICCECLIIISAIFLLHDYSHLNALFSFPELFKLTRYLFCRNAFKETLCGRDRRQETYITNGPRGPHVSMASAYDNGHLMVNGRSRCNSSASTHRILISNTVLTGNGSASNGSDRINRICISNGHLAVGGARLFRNNKDTAVNCIERRYFDF